MVLELLDSSRLLTLCVHLLLQLQKLDLFTRQVKMLRLALFNVFKYVTGCFEVTGSN